MIEVEDDVREPVYGRILLWSMRLLAVLWFAKGLQHWSVVIGVGDQGTATFETQPVVVQVAVSFFAIVDLVAAVGLWMAAPWGGVIWLVTALTYAVLDFTVPAITGSQPLLVLAIIGLIGSYIFVAYKAAREGADDE